MKKFVLSAFALMALVACAPQQPAELTQEELVARGEYLVNNIGGCNDCHTPMTPQGPDMAQSLQGATLGFAPTVPIPWAPVAPPIAGIPAHYTQEQFAAFLQTGLRPDGSHPLPPMPAFRLNEADARAMTAYIATLPSANAASE
jgi:cytochrome c553